jgi:predicted dehydrogenase
MVLKLAFIGTGYISKIHAQAARTVSDVELVAAVNHRAESMAAFAEQFGIQRQYMTVEELLADGDVDAVSINTPNYLHAPQAIAALKAGVHVMVEKPMAVNAAECEAMVAASRESGAKLMVAHCWRFHDDVLWLKQQVESGALGDIVRTRGMGVHVNWGPSGWFAQAKYAGGGAMADMGIHAVDTARFLLGHPQPVSVYAKIGTYYGNFDVDDTGLVVINWDSGTTSIIESGWWQPHADGPESGTQLYGTKGYGQTFPTFLKHPDLATRQFKITESGFPPVRDPQSEKVMYERQMAYFVDCIRNDSDPVPGGVEGWVNMKIVDAAYESSRTGKVVEIR